MTIGDIEDPQWRAAAPATSGKGLGPDERSPLPLSAQRLIVLALILAPLVALKIWFQPGLGVGTDDGNLYYHIARHVADGDGLVTSISLYHQDLVPLPHKSTIYPLWPLLLGYAGRWIGLPLAAHILPEVFFFADLLMLYLLFSKVESRAGPTETIFTSAHAAVAVLGSSTVFFRYTSTPFTEGLAFFFMIASLLAVDRSVGRFRSGWPALAGVLAGLAYLTRYQLLVFGAAIVASYLLYAIRNRDARRAAAQSAVGVLAVVVPWWIHLVRIVPHFKPILVLDFAAQTGEIHRPMRWMVETRGIGGLVLDRLSGFAAAFSPVGESSYLAAFSIAALLVPLALVLALAGLRVRPIFVERQQGLTALAIALSSIFVLIPVHLIHQRAFTEWLFGRRHGLYFAFLIALAFFWLNRVPQRMVAWSANLVVVIAMTMGLLSIVTVGSSDWPLRPSNAVRTLAAWLDSQPHKPTVLTTDPQLMGTLSGANFYWIGCIDSAADRAAMMRELHIDYVIVFQWRDRSCPFLADSPGSLRSVRTFGTGHDEVLLLEPVK